MMLWVVLTVLGGLGGVLVLFELDQRLRRWSAPPPRRRCACVPTVGHLCTARHHFGEFDPVEENQP